MTSLLRQIVAGPRAHHPEANLDLCYVTDNIIATSGPSGTYPQLAYRNPLKQLVSFLDRKHGEEWCIWEFRAEGTGYPDHEVYGRVRHFPWPDHHPPPFALVPRIVGGMRNWLHEEGKEGKRVVVVHCKAGKGRSGTMSCSYLIAEEGWTPEQAKQRFTERRMRPGFGAGISIPSQVRTIDYVDRWTKGGKLYVERPAEVLEVHVWGLRDGVKIAVEGFAEEGKKIQAFHTFSSKEREIVRGETKKQGGFADVVAEAMGKRRAGELKESSTPSSEKSSESPTPDSTGVSRSSTKTMDSNSGGDVIFRPSSRVVLPTSDINIDFERRNKTKYGGFTMVTSVAHVWFNIFFEGQGPEKNGKPDDSGTFEIDFDAMDGIKGSSRKGTRAFDRMVVVWKAATDVPGAPAVQVSEPAEGQEVRDNSPADWRGEKDVGDDSDKKLGLRAQTDTSRDVSRASSTHSHSTTASKGIGAPDEIDGVKAHGPQGEEDPGKSQERLALEEQEVEDVTSPDRGRKMDTTESMAPQVDGVTEGVGHLSTADLPSGAPEEDLQDHHGHAIGKLSLNDGFKPSS